MKTQTAINKILKISDMETRLIKFYELALKTVPGSELQKIIISEIKQTRAEISAKK